MSLYYYYGQRCDTPISWACVRIPCWCLNQWRYAGRYKVRMRSAFFAEKARKLSPRPTQSLPIGHRPRRLVSPAGPVQLSTPHKRTKASNDCRARRQGSRALVVGPKFGGVSLQSKCWAEKVVSDVPYTSREVRSRIRGATTRKHADLPGEGTDP